jgi:hypothetical protein
MELSDDELLFATEREFTVERKASLNILSYLKEISARKLYAKRGFPSLFWMLIRYFRQSESAAHQRLKALELMLEVPIAETRLLSGELNLSTLALAQRQILRQEKLTGNEVPRAKKTLIVESIIGKTLAQAEVELFKHLPETAEDPKTVEHRISASATRMHLTIPDDVRAMMTQLQEIWAHVDPKMDPVEVIRRSFKSTLQQVDPAKKKITRRSTQSVKLRGRLTYYPREHDRELWTRAGSCCEYVDLQSGRRCECKFGLQREHIIPIARGGTNELSNMQLLCQSHNQLRAQQVFGPKSRFTGSV